MGLPFGARRHIRLQAWLKGGTQMRVTIMVGGSVGGYFEARFAFARHDVVFFAGGNIATRLRVTG